MMTRAGVVALLGGAALASSPDDDESKLLAVGMHLSEQQLGRDEVVQNMQLSEQQLGRDEEEVQNMQEWSLGDLVDHVVDNLFGGNDEPAVVEPSWTTLFASGSYGATRLTSFSFNDAFRKAYHKSGVSIVRRKCDDCHSDLKEVYFRRKRDIDHWDAYDGLLVTWRGDLGFHTDFDIYPSLSDALNDQNAFQFCNGDDFGIGFPRDCGPRGHIPHQWTSLTRGGRLHYEYAVYSLYKVEQSWMTLHARGSYGNTDLSADSFNDAFRQGYYKTGASIVRRKCDECHDDLKEVYFRRRTDLNSWDAYDGLLVTWRGDVGFHVDFDIFPTLTDALSNTNAFQFCNGNDPGIGFPRDCGPSVYIPYQWTSLTRGGKLTNYEYAVYTVKDDCDERLHGHRESGYRGCQDTTVDGEKCQKWTMQSPHQHHYTPENNPKMGLGDHNYCRNPDEDSNIWCFTTDQHTRWNYCNPKKFVCDETYEGNGYGYRGCQDHTHTGKKCQQWTAQHPHEHTREPSVYPNTGLGFHNYCRNPDEDTRIWCYTEDDHTRWDFCDPLDAEPQLKWIGCYLDDNHRDLHNGPRAYGYTIETCDTACVGFKFFALQNNGWCVCSDKVSRAATYTKQADSECGSPCSGEKADVSPKYCGAGWRNAVYSVSRYAEPADEGDVQWVGCYVDDGDRDLEQGPNAYGYTIDTCHTACAGYKYFALQNNGWCVCGNEVGTAVQYTKQPDRECGGFCKDETADVPRKFCGAAWRNAVYTVTLSAEEPAAPGVTWEGCYTDDAQRDLEDGPKDYGYTIETCDTACKGFKYFALQNNGWCVCGNEVGTAEQYTKQPDSECGGFCRDETAAVFPKHCGDAWRNAVYRVSYWEPKVCCRAMTADCLACAADLTAAEYCEQYPDTLGCEQHRPTEPKVCCRAMTPVCLACQAGMSTAQYCDLYPLIEGCEKPC